MSKDDGGSAFPATEVNYHNENMRGPGMSLRDYFAAGFASAQATATSADSNFISPDYVVPGAGEAGGESVANKIARNAYLLADAMIAARTA